MSSVSIKGLKKVYDNKVTAVHEFNLEVADKEFVVLVGPSGCGKSTTLRMVAGLEEISDGDLYIDGVLMNNVAPNDRDIAMVFQNYALYPHMTVYGNMAFALKLKKTPKNEIDLKVRNAAEILGITEYLNRKPKALSGGQRQRVAIGRAIVREPKVFLMDEPLSNLDAKLRTQMRAELIKLRHSINTTFMYVTHDQTEALTLGDRIVVMKDGYVMQIGTPRQVYDRPANVFVAGFIGSPQMNFFDGQLERLGESFSLTINGVVFSLSDEIQSNLCAGDISSRAVKVGVRPEHVRLAEPGSSGALSGKIDVCERMGGEVHLHLSTDSGDVVLRVQAVELTDEQQGGDAYGNDIGFTFLNSCIHLFDPETENNLLSDLA